MAVISFSLTAFAENLGPSVGKEAPDIGMRSDQTGKPPTLADLMGKNGLLLMFSRSADASSSKMLARIAVARKILTILNATLIDKNNGNPLDTQHSC
jgi:hypothetical protein